MEVEGKFHVPDRQTFSELPQTPSPAGMDPGPVPVEGSAHEGPGVPAAVPLERPRSPGILPDDTMSQAGRKVMRLHFQRMVYHEPGTRLGTDIEALHDMRVATRRMRAAARIFGDYFEPVTLARHTRRMRRTGRRLGPVRDLDVLMANTEAYRDSLPPGEHPDLDRFLAVLEARRDAARVQMIAYLESRRYRRFKERLERFLAVEGQYDWPRPILGRQPCPDCVREVAPVAIYQRLAMVRAFEDEVTVSDPSPERLHALRIACKRLRYTVEFFEEVLGPRARTLIKEIVALQDHLGAVQDAVVAGGILREYLDHGAWGTEAAAEAPRPAPGVEAYLAAQEAEYRRLMDTFPAAWQRIQRPAFGRLVGEVVRHV